MKKNDITMAFKHVKSVVDPTITYEVSHSKSSHAPGAKTFISIDPVEHIGTDKAAQAHIGSEVGTGVYLEDLPAVLEAVKYVSDV
jgi:triosephosphate isomerase